MKTSAMLLGMLGAIPCSFPSGAAGAAGSNMHMKRSRQSSRQTTRGFRARRHCRTSSVLVSDT
eukprot:762476-Hanusia_phi.AAC.10